MLLVDHLGKRLASVRAAHASVAYVRGDRPRSVDRAHEFLRRFRYDSVGLRSTMIAELRLASWIAWGSEGFDEYELTGAVARALVAGWIPVGFTLSHVGTIAFNPKNADADPSSGVVFATTDATRGFLERALKVEGGRAAFEAAMEHAGPRKVPQGVSLDDAATELLTRGEMVILPGSAGAFRIAFRAVLVSGSGSADLGAPAPGPPPPPPPATAPPGSSAPGQSAPAAANPVPEKPAEMTDQAKTLVEAAKQGAPFCEECARLAAQKAAAAAQPAAAPPPPPTTSAPPPPSPPQPTTAPPPPPPVVPPPADPVADPVADKVPEKPPVLSDQAKTMVDAAKSGAPFCEECAALAAEKAAAAAAAPPPPAVPPPAPPPPPAGTSAPPPPPVVPPPPAPADPVPDPVADKVPDKPAVLSDQGKTMAEAAKSGAPFCEECAKLAAEKAAETADA